MTVQRLRNGRRRRIDNDTMRLFLLDIDADGTETVGGVYDVDYSIDDDLKETVQWAISRIDAAKTEAEINETPMLRSWLIFD